jgi:MFS family permease
LIEPAAGKVSLAPNPRYHALVRLGFVKPQKGSTMSSSDPSRHYRWYVVAMLWWISFFNYADRQAIFSVFPLLREEMGLSNTQLGLIGSSFAWVYGLSAPFAGAVVDRVSRRAAILLGLYVWSLICMATALSRQFWHLVFWRAAEGLGETCYYPAATSLLSDYHGKTTRSRALGLHQTSVYAGTIGGGFFAGWIAQSFGWKASFVLFGGLGVLLGLVLARYLREPERGAADRADGVAPPREERLPLLETLRLIWTTPTVLLLMLAFLCANFVAMVLLAWMPGYLAASFGMNLAMSGLTATASAQVASLAGATLGGVLADRWRQRTPGGRVYVQALGVFGGAPFVLLCGQTTTVAVLIFALMAWGFFKGLYDANIFAAVFDAVPPEARGSTAGFMNLVGWLGGGASAPLVVGILADIHGLGWAISCAAAVYLAAGAFLMLAATLFVRRDAGRWSPLTEEEIEALVELWKTPGGSPKDERLTPARARPYLQRLEEIRRRDGMDEATLRDLLRRMQAGEEV